MIDTNGKESLGAGGTPSAVPRNARARHHLLRLRARRGHGARHLRRPERPGLVLRLPAPGVGAALRARAGARHVPRAPRHGRRVERPGVDQLRDRPGLARRPRVRARRHRAAASGDPGGPEPEPRRRRQRVGPGQRPDCVHHASPPGAGGHPREEHAPVTPPLVLLPYRLETRFVQGLGGTAAVGEDLPEPDLDRRSRPAAVARRDGRRQALLGRRLGGDHGGGGKDPVARAGGRVRPAARGVRRAERSRRATTPRASGPAPRPVPVSRPACPSVPARSSSRASRSSCRTTGPWSPTATTSRHTAWTRCRCRLALAVGPTPNATPVLDPASGLTVDEGMRWLVDFETAVQAGMGVRIDNLSSADLRLGFDKIVAFGLPRLTVHPGPMTHAAPPPPPPDQAPALAALFEAHRFTDGLAFLPQGSPTNNTPEARSAYARGDTGYETSFATERGAPLDLNDAAIAASALGIPAETFEHTEHADQRRPGRLAPHGRRAVARHARLLPLADDGPGLQLGSGRIRALVVPRACAPARRGAGVPSRLHPVRDPAGDLAGQLDEHQARAGHLGGRRASHVHPERQARHGSTAVPTRRASAGARRRATTSSASSEWMRAR